MEQLTKLLSKKLDMSQAEVKEKAEEISSKEGISVKGSLFFIAQENDINVKEGLKEIKEKTIDELEPDMNNITLLGRVDRKFDVNTFERDDGSTGRVANLILLDETGSTRITFWGDKIHLFKELEEGDIIKIINSNTRKNQGRIDVNLNYNSRVIKSPEDERVGKIPETPEKTQAEPKNFDIGEVPTGRSGINVIGRVNRKFDINNFERDDGTMGQVGSLITFDETGNIRVTFWSDKIDEFKKIEPGDIIKINNSYSRQGQRGVEIHLNEDSEVIFDPEDEKASDIPPMRETRDYNKSKIKDLKIGEDYKISGTLVSLYRIGYYESCPECMRSLSEDEETGGLICEDHGAIDNPVKRLYCSFGIDDESGFLRGTGFGNVCESLLEEESNKIIKNLEEIKEDLDQKEARKSITSNYKKVLGKELEIRGSIEEEEFFGKQILANSVRNINVKGLIEENLEKAENLLKQRKKIKEEE